MAPFPLTTGFRATTFRRAFVLNALVTASVAAIAISLRKAVDESASKAGGLPKHLSEGGRTLIVLAATSLAALLVYQLMYMLLGFGGGMLVNGPFERRLY